MKLSDESTNYLFNCDFFADDFDPEGQEDHLDTAEKLLEENTWTEVFEMWSNYLFINCHTAEAVINFVNLYVYYGAAQKKIPEPIKFLGYLYYMVDMEEYWDNAGDLFDGVAVSILSQSGLVNTLENPYYNPLKDQRIMKAIERWKSGEYVPETDSGTISATKHRKDEYADG